MRSKLDKPEGGRSKRVRYCGYQMLNLQTGPVFVFAFGNVDSGCSLRWRDATVALSAQRTVFYASLGRIALDLRLSAGLAIPTQRQI
jgi:hypothetical protein